MNIDTISKRKVRRNDNRSGYNIFIKNNILKSATKENESRYK